MNYDDVISALEEAGQNRNKIAMFHYISLKHAEDFIDEDAKSFCKAVGMQESYSTEFLKMRALYLLMKEKNLEI